MTLLHALPLPATAETGRTVGWVAGLWRYPVKSMGAEPLDDVEVAWHGLAGDRRWGFVRQQRASSGFPWLTIRERADLVRHVPWFVEPGRPERSATLVRIPDGAVLDVTDPKLAAALGDGIRVIRQDRGVFDAMPLTLLTTRSVARIGELVGARLDVARFRPNLLIEPTGSAPFSEDGWVGSVLRVGGLRLRVDRRNQRCAVVNVDPETAERDPAVLRAIAGQRALRLGVYGSTVRPGRVAVGDPVVIEG